MAMSYGQHKMADGFSHGPQGHGGVHRVGAHGAHSSNSPMSSPHVQGHNLGHTMSGDHGGGINVGCC